MRPRRSARPVIAAWFVAATWLAPALVAAQDPPIQPDTTPLARIPQGQEGWNTRRVARLVERARDRRREPVADSSLRNYRADVTGHIYFFIDREEDPEPVLLRADQVALELYWGQPDRVKQVIRGMRSENQFPIRDFRYYLDRYTVIQNGFDDVIRVGEGRDVRDVIHPLAFEGGQFYDFRLADSTTIRLPGEPDPIRVYEIQVRPRSFGEPAIVGSLFVERARGDLVRLAFTFTPASYIDPRNERVEVVLENALWEGRYWLPREQRLLVRREIPEIDLDVGTVIRAALRVEDYTLNIDLPRGFFGGREVVVAGGPETLAAYDFDDGLFDGFADVGLEGAEPGTLDAVDVEAISGPILREAFLRGVPRIRLFAPAASDALRYGRTEGLVTGAGLAVGVGRSQAYVYGGYAWGSGDPLARVGWRPAGPETGAGFVAEAYLNRPYDVGLRPATAGIMSSLSSALLGRDYRDIVPVSGITLGSRWGNDQAGRTRLAGGIEVFRPGVQAAIHAPADDQRLFRPVTPADSGSQLVGVGEQTRRRRVGPVTVSTAYRIEVGAALPLWHRDADAPLLSDGFVRFLGEVSGRWRDGRRRTGAEAQLTLGLGRGGLADHQLWYIGGPGTLPGHPFHAYAGRTAGLATATVWRSILPRYVRVRTFGGLGFTDGPDVVDYTPPLEAVVGADPTGLDPWPVRATRGLEGSFGVGLGLVDGVVRVDYAMRADTMDGVVIISVSPDLWSFL